MKLFNKNIHYLLVACMSVFVACDTEEEKKYDDTSTVIAYDEYMDPLTNYGVYYYSNLDNTIQVKFGVDDAAKAVQVYLQPQDGKYGSAKTIEVPADKVCVLTYSPDELDWDVEKDEKNEAMVKVTNGNVTKEIVLVSISPWYNLTRYKAGYQTSSSIVTGKSYAAIESKQVNDTITFTASVDSWINVDAAAWTMEYKKGKKGTPVAVTPEVTTKKNAVRFVASMKDLGVAAKDTVFVSATVTNNGLTRTGIYPILVQNISTAMSSKSTNGKTFKPSVSKSVNDTINMQAVVLKSGSNRSWLKANGSTWDAAYTVGASEVSYPFGGIVKVKTENDTMSIAQIIGALGQLPDVAQYDTVFMTGYMNINGARYPVKQSYVVSK